MATKQPKTADASAPTPDTKLEEARAKMKAATERHAALVAVTSGLRTSPQERRLAQSQSKKVEHELQDAKRLLREAEAAAGPGKVSGSH